MKVLIAGSRGFYDYERLCQAMKTQVTAVTEVVSGGARGADQLGERWARKMDIPCTLFLADWNTYGKSAGYKRNVQMAEYAEGLIALWDGVSRGTKHMIDIMRGLRKPVRIVRV